MLKKSVFFKLSYFLVFLGFSASALSWDGGDLTDLSYISGGDADVTSKYTTSTWDGAGTVSYAGIYQENGEEPDGWNVAMINQTDGIGHLAMIWQSGAYNYAFVTQGGGDHNAARVSQVGDNHFANVIQSGSSNTVSLVQVGSLTDTTVAFPTLSGTDTQYEGNTYTTIALVTQIGNNNYLSAKLNVGSVLNATQLGDGNSLSLTLAPGTFVGVTQSR